MRRKLWLLLIYFLFLVGRESCCASQEQNVGPNIGKNVDIDPAAGVSQSVVQKLRFYFFILIVCFNSLGYWIFDLHQKYEGWYTCKFYYAAGYRTKLFLNRIYLDFFSSFPQMIISRILFGFPGLVWSLFLININLRIYRDFYIVFTLTILQPLVLKVFPSSQEEIEQEEIDN